MRLVLIVLIVAVGCGGDDGVHHPPDAPGGSVPFTNATMFRVDSEGTNLQSSGGHITRGVWNTKTGVQNVPGNYVVRLFLATTPDPDPTTLLPLAEPLATALVPGDNVFYLFADRDDVAGGNFGFGLNLWLDDATAATPSISAFVSTTTSSAFTANSTTGCTPGFDALCAPPSNTLTAQAGRTVTLTAFSITGVGGGPASGSCVDKVGADNTGPVVTNMPNSICDTVGTFTLTVH